MTDRELVVALATQRLTLHDVAHVQIRELADMRDRVLFAASTTLLELGCDPRRWLERVLRQLCVDYDLPSADEVLAALPSGWNTLPETGE